MERHDRALAAFFVAEAVTAGARVTLDSGASHHARVKRLAVRDAVVLTDGQGTIARGMIASIAKRGVDVVVETVEAVAAPSPIHLCVPVADRERMLWLAEKATELGIATWRPVRFKRSMSVAPRGEGPTFDEKARARMIGALEQSRGAWLPRVLPAVDVTALDVEAGQLPILLDVDGEPLASVLTPTDGRQPALLFGPEGGLECEERAALIDRGWLPARVADTTLRFETAGIAAIAVCRNREFVTENRDG